MTQIPSFGPYRIARRIATGGMAEVFEAFREGPHGFEKQVALKRILPQHSNDPDFVRMFVDEARIAARFQHPNIVQVFDFGDHDGQLFLAMELVQGTTASRLVRALSAAREPLPVELAVYVAWKVASALDHAHRQVDREGRSLGFVHRDVSPANVLIGRHGHVKLTDFGIATVRVRTPTTEDGHVRGKVGYMSPEQVLGHELTGRSDVFTLGIVLAELAMGEPLFAFGSDLDVLLRIRDLDLSVLHRTERAISYDVKSLLLRMLTRRPDERLSAAAVADECEKLLQRRGFTHGSDRLAALIGRLGLLEGEADDPHAPGGERTSVLDPELLVEQEVDERGQIRVTTRAEYRVRTADGQVLGPISFPKLVELVTAGRVDGRTLIAKAEGAFGPARALPELTRFVTSPALGWEPAEIERAVRRGRLEGARLLSVFFSLVHGQETGVLHLWDATRGGAGGAEVRRKKIYFVSGRPDFVASTDRRELLGEFLVARGYCLRMEVDMALALMPRYGGRLGDALVGLGVLRPVHLFRAISEQVRERMLEAFRWRSGEWAFVDGVRSHEETFPLGYDPYELLRDAVLRAHPAELEAALSPLRELVLVPARRPPVALRTFRLPEEWVRVLRAVDGQRTFAALLAHFAMEQRLDPESVYRAVHLGTTCGLVQPA